MIAILNSVSRPFRSSWVDKREAGGAEPGQHPPGPGPPSPSQPLWLSLPLPQTAAENGRSPSAGDGERPPGSENQKDWVGDVAAPFAAGDLQRHVLAVERDPKASGNTVTDWTYIYNSTLRPVQALFHMREWILAWGLTQSYWHYFQ